MKSKHCLTCKEMLPLDCFRKDARSCVWCSFSSKSKRAEARYHDKKKLANSRLNITRDDFVAWYKAQDDCCTYCGLTFDELRRLKIKRGGNNYVSWDIDRIDPSRHYEPGNLALSCFVCNMAKGDILSFAEACVVGEAVRRVWRARLTSASCV